MPRLKWELCWFQRVLTSIPWGCYWLSDKTDQWGSWPIPILDYRCLSGAGSKTPRDTANNRYSSVSHKVVQCLHRTNLTLTLPCYIGHALWRLHHLQLLMIPRALAMLPLQLLHSIIWGMIMRKEICVHLIQIVVLCIRMTSIGSYIWKLSHQAVGAIWKD